MLTRYALILLFLVPAFAQVISPPLIDFSLVGITKPVTMGSTLPDTCQDGQFFYSTSAPAGANLFSCKDGVYASIGSGVPPSLLPTATSTTLGMVMVPDSSGLTLNAGALSILYGTGPNTAAQGNDARILGALQASNNLSDLTNVATARATLGLSLVAQSGSYADLLNPPQLAKVAASGLYVDLAGRPLLSSVASSGLYADLLNKPAIPTDTKQLSNGAGFLGPSSNAASATKLAATPIGCTAGKYATGVTSSGIANCAQVQYSQLGSLPVSYSLPQASSTLLGGVVYGTTLGTAAQGNDSRIVGALQKATGLADLKLTGATPIIINSSTTGNAATATRAGTASSLQGTGILRMKGTCGAFPFSLGTGERGAWFDVDCNLHLRDQANLNRSVMVETWVNGKETICDQSQGFSAVTDFSASGAPVCTVAPAPPVLPTGVTASGSSCAITAITNGVITGANCAP